MNFEHFLASQLLNAIRKRLGVKNVRRLKDRLDHQTPFPYITTTYGKRLIIPQTFADVVEDDSVTPWDIAITAAYWDGFFTIDICSIIYRYRRTVNDTKVLVIDANDPTILSQVAASYKELREANGTMAKPTKSSYFYHGDDAAWY